MKARILKKYEDEIQQLERELKTELPKEIKRAREMGDLSEKPSTRPPRSAGARAGPSASASAWARSRS
jgi:transcription elongation GreA/GreB family factor